MKDLTKISKLKISYLPRVKASDRIAIGSSKEVAKLLREIWDKGTIEHIEEFKMLLLNRANKVLGLVDLSKGGIAGTVVDVKVVMQYALLANASSIVLAHNHPSGNLNPSDQDKQITNKIKEAAKLFNIQVLDHLIITFEGYCSLADDGFL